MRSDGPRHVYTRELVCLEYRDGMAVIVKMLVPHESWFGIIWAGHIISRASICTVPGQFVSVVRIVEDACRRGCRGMYLLVDFWFIGHVVNEVESHFAATSIRSLVVSPAPPHAVTAPVVVVEGTNATLRE